MADAALNVSLAANNTFADNTTATDPVRIFDTAASTILANSAKLPNFGIITRDGFVAIKNHVSILDRIKYTSAEITLPKIAGLFDLPVIHVAQAMYDTAAEGLAPSMSNFWGDIAFVGWKPSSPGLKTPSCGYMFQSKAPRVRTWVDEERNAKAIEVEMKLVPKVVASLTGYLINNAV